MASPRDPFPFLPRGPALLRRVMLAELLGPPRSRQRGRGLPAPPPPLEAAPPEAAPDEAPPPKPA